jgi:hypothetical protein
VLLIKKILPPSDLEPSALHHLLSICRGIIRKITIENFGNSDTTMWHQCQTIMRAYKLSGNERVRENRRASQDMLRGSIILADT